MEDLVYLNKRKKRETDLLTIAYRYKEFVESCGSIKKASEIIGISETTIKIYLKILELPDIVKNLVACRKIDCIMVIRELSKIKNEELLLEIIKNINKLNVSQIRHIKCINKLTRNAQPKRIIEYVLSKGDKYDRRRKNI